MPCDKALTEVGRLYGTSMDASPVFKDKILVIEAHQVNEKEIRDQIAKTLDGTWERKETFWHLTQTSEQKKQEGQRQLKWRTKMLQMMLDHRLKVKNSTAPFDRGFAERTFQQIVSNGISSFVGPSDTALGQPGMRLMTRFLKKFRVDRIASVPPAHRRVFTAVPNQMQSPMGFDLEDELRQYKIENELMKSVVTAHAKPGEYEGELSGDTDFDQLGSVLFTVYCDPNSEYHLQLNGYSKDFKKVVFYAEATSFEALFNQLTPEDLAEFEKPEFKPTQEAIDFHRLVSGNKNAIPRDRFDRVLLLATDPIARDPLSFGISEGLFFEASMKKKNLIASIDDSEINNIGTNPLMFNLYKKLKEFASDFQIEDGNWLRMRPLPFAQPTFSRPELKQIMRRVVQAKEFLLNEQSRVAAQQSRNYGSSDITKMLMAIAQKNNVVGISEDALRTYGLLFTAEFRAASSEKGIPYSRLNTKLQQHLFDCVYNSRNTNLQIIGISPRLRNTYFASEPTLLAPFGIPNESHFRVETTEEPLMKMDDLEDKNGTQLGDTRSAESWGAMKYYSEHSELKLGAPVDTSRRFRRITSINYKFRLSINPNCEWAISFLNFVPDNNESFLLENMPEDIKKAFDAGYRATAKQHKGDGELLHRPS